MEYRTNELFTRVAPLVGVISDECQEGVRVWNHCRKALEAHHFGGADLPTANELAKQLLA